VSLRPIYHRRSSYGRSVGAQVVRHRPRRQDPSSKPPATEDARRRTCVQRAEERQQKDRRPASEGLRSPQKAPEGADGGTQLRAGSNWQDYRLVFASCKGTPLDAQNIVNRHFKPLLKRAGLPDIRWHDLRHTYATLLLARGTHPTYVQKSLGHASVQLTLDRYSHRMPSMGRNTAEGVDAALG
jgi:integrase